MLINRDENPLSPDDQQQLQDFTIAVQNALQERLDVYDKRLQGNPKYKKLSPTEAVNIALGFAAVGTAVGAGFTVTGAECLIGAGVGLAVSVPVIGLVAAYYQSYNKKLDNANTVKGKFAPAAGLTVAQVATDIVAQEQDAILKVTNIQSNQKQVAKYLVAKKVAFFKEGGNKSSKSDVTKVSYDLSYRCPALFFNTTKLVCKNNEIVGVREFAKNFS